MKRGLLLLLCLLLAVGMMCSATGCGEKDTKKEESSALSDEAQEARDDAEVYYKSHFVKDTDIGLCADVTGDEIPELIVVRYTTETPGAIEGTVYTLSDGKMKPIYTKRGSFYHGGGFFSWYLAPNGENSFYFAEETHAMWTGIGTVTTRVYQLDASGNEKEIDSIVFSTDDWENLEQQDNGEWRIKQSAWDAYGDDVQEMLKGGYIIYTNASNCDLFHALSYLDDEYYLSDLRELSDTPPSLEDNGTIPEDEPSDTPAVTPASSTKPTSPVDRPHVDTVDAAFWRDAEPAIKAWKRAMFFGGAFCDFEWENEAGRFMGLNSSEQKYYASLLQTEEDRERFLEQTGARDCVAISRCCHTYEEVKEHNQQYLSKNYLQEWLYSGDRAIGEKESPVFEINGEIWAVFGTSKPTSPNINVTTSSFDFSNPNRPEVTVYSPEVDGILIYTFAFVKENGTYKIDGTDSEWIEDGVYFQQLKEDLSEYYTVSSDYFNPVYVENYTLDSPVWICVPVDGNGVDSILVNLTTGEAHEAISGSDAFSLDDYTLVGESFYVPISW